MDEQAILVMLKADLEKPNSVNDEYLSQLIEVAKAKIAKEGVELVAGDDGYSVEDCNLIVMYAAYLYRNRVSNNEGYQTAALYPQGMPYMLRYALNERHFAPKDVKP